MEFSQNGDGTIDPEGIVLADSDPTKVRGLCLSCSHRWTIRGVSQIIHVSGHPDYGKYSKPTKRRKPGGQK